MLTCNTLPHGWRDLMAEAERFGVRIMAIHDSAQQLAEYDAEIARLLKEADDCVNRAASDARELTETEEKRLLAIMGAATDGTDGEVHALKAKREAMANRMAAKKQLASDIVGLQRNRYSGLVSRDEESIDGLSAGGRSNKRSASGGIELRDSANKPLRVALGSDRLFQAAGSNGGFGDREPVQDLGGVLWHHLRGERDSIQGAALTSFDSTGGLMVGEQLAGFTLDAVRAGMPLTKINVMSVAMTAPTMNVLAVDGTPSGSWVHEMQAVAASNVTFRQLVLKARKARTIVVITREMLDDSANGMAVIQQVCVEALASTVQRAALVGSGVGAEPLGILNTSGLRTVTGVGYPGETYAHWSRAIGEVMQQSFPGQPSELSLLVHPRDGQVMDLATDLNGNPLQRSAWFSQVPVYTTTDLPTNLGSGEDESEALLLHGPSILMAYRNEVRVRIHEGGSVVDANGDTIKAPEQDVVFVSLDVRMDVATLRPQWCCAISGLLGVDPA